MRILVDADACPAKDIIFAAAKARELPVILLADGSHRLETPHATVITVDKGRDSADIRLINLLEKGDLVITQDYGVAALALGKGGHALHPSGLRYTAENIDRLLFERHMGQKLRQAGSRTAGPKKRTRQDDAAFALALEELLDEVRRFH